MFEFWLGIINDSTDYEDYCCTIGWSRRQAAIDDPLIALYQDDPTNFQMLKHYIRDQICLKVSPWLPHHMWVAITLEDECYREYIQLDKFSTETYLEVAFDQTKMRQIGNSDLLWTRSMERLRRRDGTGRLKYNVTEYMPRDACMLVDTILERFPGICPSALVKRKTALAMALHPRLGANSAMCIDAEIMAMVSKLVVD
jgi:hypothetical protein